jgi:hypothetical protein
MTCCRFRADRWGAEGSSTLGIRHGAPLAAQIGLPEVAALLSKSLAEEEIADSLMTPIARELIRSENGHNERTEARHRGED